MQSVTPPPFPKIKLKELNMHLKCILCGGYYIDATTIIECLHSFCKTCIVRYLETHKFCPICDVQIHKTRPLINIRSDQTLQDIVYKAVPGLFKSEMKRRREFYSQHPDALTNGTVVPTSSEGRGEVLGGERLIFTPEDYINISLESCPPTVLFPPHGNLISTLNNWPGNNRRYFRCPGSLTVAHLKKLLRNKYGLSPNCKIDISYVHDYLDESYTMIDLAYIYSWRRNGDLRLFYQTEKDLLLKRRRLDNPADSVIDTTLENSKNVDSNQAASSNENCEESEHSSNSKNDESLVNGEKLSKFEVSALSTDLENVNKDSLKNKQEEPKDKLKDDIGNGALQSKDKESKSPEKVEIKNDLLPEETKQNNSIQNPNTCSPKIISGPVNVTSPKHNIQSNGSLTVKQNGIISSESTCSPIIPGKDKIKSPVLANRNIVNFSSTMPGSIPEHLQQIVVANSNSVAHYHQLHLQHQLQQERNRLNPVSAKISNEQRIQPCPNTLLNLRVNPAIAPGIQSHSLPHLAPAPVRGIQKSPRGRKPPQRRRTVRLLQGQIGHTVQQQLQHQQQKQQQQQQIQAQQQHFHNIMVHNAQVQQQIQQAMLAGQFFSQARLPPGPFRHNEHLNLSIAQNITENLQQQQRLAAAFNQTENRLSLPTRLANESNNSHPSPSATESSSPTTSTKTPQSSPTNQSLNLTKPLTPTSVPFSNAVPNSSTSPCLTSTAASTAVSSSHSLTNSASSNDISNSTSNKNEHSPSKSPAPLSRVANYLAKWLPECEPTSPEAYDIQNPLSSTNICNANDKSKENTDSTPANDTPIPKSKS